MSAVTRLINAADQGASHAWLNVSDIEIAAPVKKDAPLLDVDKNFDQFALHEPTKAELVKLRFFAGITLEEAGAVLGLSERTAKRHWAYARAWLYVPSDQQLRSMGPFGRPISYDFPI
jgi:DNA-directed RNA polymerase specialized sigma24 family protein